MSCLVAHVVYTLFTFNFSLGNGKVDLPEFIQLMEKMTNPKEENTSTMEAFRVFDSDGRGYISTKCIREVTYDSNIREFISTKIPER